VKAAPARKVARAEAIPESACNHGCDQHRAPDHDVECPERNAAQLGRRRVDDEYCKDSLREAYMEDPQPEADHEGRPRFGEFREAEEINALAMPQCGERRRLLAQRLACARCGIVTSLAGVAAKEVAMRT
jgi:hypothetical protein